MNSAIYEGWVRHRRFAPREHWFRYPLFMLLIDLDELPRLFDDNWLWSASRPALARFRRSDHLGAPEVPLAQAVRDLVFDQTGRRPVGPIRLLTHFRYAGYGFNPVSFYYCFDASGQRVETIVAEVDNTPWGERHPYVLDESTSRGRSGSKTQRFVFPKSFHVSPFMPMQQTYDWRFGHPGTRLVVHMQNLEQGEAIFDATLVMQRRDWTRGNLNRMLWRYPLMTLRVIGAIYWQAFRLWLKRTPFHEHPKHRLAETSRDTSPGGPPAETHQEAVDEYWRKSA